MYRFRRVAVVPPACFIFFLFLFYVDLLSILLCKINIKMLALPHKIKRKKNQPSLLLALAGASWRGAS